MQKKYLIFLATLAIAGCSEDLTSFAVDSGSETLDTGAGDTDGTGTEDSGVTEDVGGTEDSGVTEDVGGTEDGGVEPGECPASLFVQQAADPANDAYDDPSLNAYCEGGELIVEANGIIAYEFVSMTPNALAAQDYEWHIPLEPVWMDDAEDIALLGEVGIAINGLPIYGPNEGEFPDPYGDPVYNGIMDVCQGHTAQRGDYHYHALIVDCLTASTPNGEPDPIIGYSFDGYAIYGSMGCTDEDCDEVVEFQSGWQQTGDPTTYAWDNHAYEASDDPTVLDRCNGRIGPDGTYRYHATATFPYILGCQHGEVAGGDGGDGGDDPGGAPTSCTETSECVGECDGAGTGCVCAPGRDGDLCVPSCDADDDCPDAFACTGGFCRPEGGPGGGGAP
ncbi:MAG: hypothetical protein ACJAYU_003887 [Bradymonadia bacterium]|jgi:hypothetical protein